MEDTPRIPRLVALELWESFHRDADHGRVADGAAYAARYPNCSEHVRREWARFSATRDGDLAAGELRFGRFLVTREIARGGQATVYEAIDPLVHERRVALKVMSRARGATPADALRLRREVELAARIDHPAVCAIHEVGETDGSAWIAMRFVDGETLADRIARGERLEWRDAVKLIARLARAVDACHGHGVVHRDLKPANIAFDARGEPVILDFGVAYDATADATLTHDGDSIGTPAYMAPEQIDGRAAIAPPIDVFALGVVSYELIAGTRPFVGATARQVLRAVLDEDPRSLRHTTPGVPRDLALVPNSFATNGGCVNLPVISPPLLGPAMLFR